MVERRVAAALDVVAQGREAGDVGVLFEHHDARAGDDRAAALVRIDRAGEEFEEGALARAVAADEGEAVARADVDVEVAEEPAGALNEAELLVGKNGCCHGRPT